MSGIDYAKVLLSLQCKSSYQLWEISQAKIAQAGEKVEGSTVALSNDDLKQIKVNVAANVEETIESAVMSMNGSHYVVNSQEKGLSLFRIQLTPELSIEKCEVPLPDHLKACPATQLSRLTFSPKSSFLMAFFSPTGHRLHVIEGDNFVVWDLRGARAEVVHTQRCLTDPVIVWRDDELYRAWTTPSGSVHIYRCPSEGNCWKAPSFLSLNVKPRGKIEIAPRRVLGTDDELLFFTFSPAKEDTETAGVLWCYLVDSNGGKILKKSQKLFPNVDGCETQWSPSGRACLIMTSSLVDHMGENYGSVGDLWLSEYSKLLQDEDDINFTKINKLVTQDAQWSATADEFILVEGKSPSEVRFLDENGGELQTLPLGYRNRVIWNKQGNMAAIGGHGNLAGDLSFYYLHPTERQLKEVADWREPCVVSCDWSPCGRYFFAASTWPRLTVDNQVRIFARDGKLLYKKTFDCLVAVQWHLPKDFVYPPLEPPTLSSASGASKAPALYRRKCLDSKGDDQRAGSIHATTLQDDPANRGRGKVAALKKTRGGKAKPDNELPMEWRGGQQDRKPSVSMPLQQQPPAAVPPTVSESNAQPEISQQADANTSVSVLPTKLVDPYIAESTKQSVPPQQQQQNLVSAPVTTSDEPPETTQAAQTAQAASYVPRVAAPVVCERLLPQPADNPPTLPIPPAFRMPPPPPPPPPMMPSSVVMTSGGGVEELAEHAGRGPYLPENQYALNAGSTYPPRVTMIGAGGEPETVLPDYIQGNYGAPRLASYMNWPVFPGGAGGSIFEDSSPPPPQASPSTQRQNPPSNAVMNHQYMYGNNQQRRQDYNAAGRRDIIGSYHPQVTAGGCDVWSQPQPQPPQQPPPPQNYNQAQGDNGGEKVVSLLRKILPSTARVNVSPSGNSGVASPCGQSEDNGRDNLINLMRRAGIMSRAPVGDQQTRNHPQMGMVPTNAFSQAMAPNTRYVGNNGGAQQNSSDTRWLYVDPKGRIQGPFFAQQMRVWWDRGYFENTLLIKRADDMSGSFRPLGECFPDPPTAFL